MKDILAQILENKCNIGRHEARLVASSARNNLQVPDSYLWSKDLEKEAFRLFSEEKDQVTETAGKYPNKSPITVVDSNRSLELGKEEKKSIEVKPPKVVSPRRRSEKQRIHLCGPEREASPLKKKTKTFSTTSHFASALENCLGDVLQNCTPDEDTPVTATQQPLPSLLPPMRTNSHCTIDSLFSTDSIKEDFSHTTDLNGWLEKNTKWSTLRNPRRSSPQRVAEGRINSEARKDSGPRRPVRQKSYDEDDFELLLKEAKRSEAGEVDPPRRRASMIQL